MTTPRGGYTATLLSDGRVLIHSNVGRFLVLARRYDEAIRKLRDCLELHPNSAYGRIYLAIAHEQKQMYPQAMEEFRKAEALMGSKSNIGAAHVAAVLGRRKDAEDALRILEAPDPFLVAGVYAALGDRDKAFDQLERAYHNRSFLLCFMKVFPWIDPLRLDPGSRATRTSGMNGRRQRGAVFAGGSTLQAFLLDLNSGASRGVNRLQTGGSGEATTGLCCRSSTAESNLQ